MKMMKQKYLVVLFVLVGLFALACNFGGLLESGDVPAGTSSASTTIPFEPTATPEPSPTPVPQTISSTIYQFQVQYSHELLAVDHVEGLAIGNTAEGVASIVSNSSYRYKLPNYVAANMSSVTYSMIESSPNLDSAFATLLAFFSDREIAPTAKEIINGREVVYATTTADNWPLIMLIAMVELDDTQVVILGADISSDRDLEKDIQNLLAVLATAEPSDQVMEIPAGQFSSPLYNFHFSYPTNWHIIYSPAYDPTPGYGGQLVLADTSDFNTLEGGHFRASLSLLPIPGNITCSYGLSETSTPRDFQQARIEQIESARATPPTTVEHNGITIWRTEMTGQNNTVLLYAMQLDRTLFAFEALLNANADKALLDSQFLDLIASFTYSGETEALRIHNRIRTASEQLLSENYLSRTGVTVPYPAGWQIQTSDTLGTSMQGMAEQMGLNFGEQLLGNMLFGQYAPDNVILQSPTETLLQITIPSQNTLTGSNSEQEELGTQMGLLMTQMLLGVRFTSDWYEAVDGFCFRLRDSNQNGNIFVLQPKNMPYELFSFMAVHPEAVGVTERDAIITLAAQMMADLEP